MELPSLQKLDLDISRRDTNRSIKPPDRCVISYNFEQDQSKNYTHNLLIGVNHHPQKNPHHNPAQKSPSIANSHKKIQRREPETISKIYDSSVTPKRYPNPGSLSPQRKSHVSQDPIDNMLV